MPNYYTSICRTCQNDCDGEFCSYKCRQEYEEGYEDYLYDQERDRRMMEQDND